MTIKTSSMLFLLTTSEPIWKWLLCIIFFFSLIEKVFFYVGVDVNFVIPYYATTISEVDLVATTDDNKIIISYRMGERSPLRKSTSTISTSTITSHLFSLDIKFSGVEQLFTALLWTKPPWRRRCFKTTIVVWRYPYNR